MKWRKALIIPMLKLDLPNALFLISCFALARPQWKGKSIPLDGFRFRNEHAQHVQPATAGHIHEISESPQGLLSHSLLYSNWTRILNPEILMALFVFPPGWYHDAGLRDTDSVVSDLFLMHWPKPRCRSVQRRLARSTTKSKTSTRRQPTSGRTYLSNIPFDI